MSVRGLTGRERSPAKIQRPRPRLAEGQEETAKIAQSANKKTGEKWVEGSQGIHGSAGSENGLELPLGLALLFFVSVHPVGFLARPRNSPDEGRHLLDWIV